MKRQAFIAGASALCATAAVAVTHFCVASPSEFPLTGYTIYLNDILGLREIDPDFGAQPHLKNQRVAAFIKLVAYRAKEFLGPSELDCDVWMIPFGREGGTCRGWPFASKAPETIVYFERSVPDLQARPNTFRVTEDGGTPIRISGLILNWFVYFFVAVSGLWIAVSGGSRYLASIRKRKSAFPVVEEKAGHT